MKRAAFLTATIAALVVTPSTGLALSPDLSPKLNEAGAAKTASAQPDQAVPAQSWHVMISLYESMSDNSCGSQIFKVSTADPIVVQGPDTITVNHINRVVAEWKAHLRDTSPQIWRSIHGDTGAHLTDVYFRRSDEAARRAFARDGHLAREPGCWGSVLVKSPVDRFAFSAPGDFVLHTFGQEPPPPPEAAGVARELPKIPGLASRD